MKESLGLMLTRVHNYALSFTFLTPEKHDKEERSTTKSWWVHRFSNAQNSFYAEIGIVKHMLTLRLSIEGLGNFTKNNVLYDG